MSFLIDCFLNENGLPDFYSKLSETFSNDTIMENKAGKIHANQADLTSVYDVPEYMKPELSSSVGSFKRKEAPLYAGYLIHLNAYSDFQEYIKVKVRSARWSQLRRYKKRLDRCVTPIYKFYYGDNLQKDEYNRLFDVLKLMTAKRFAQKEEVNYELPYLEFYQQIMYALILKKKAAMVVIYHDEKPINITLNFFLNKTCFHWNSCYDTDYAVFNLGHINVINHLEWCFDHDFTIFDMGRGDFFHKRKWVDKTYIYKEHIVYNAKSIQAMVLANYKAIFITSRFNCIQALKRLNIQKLYGKFVRLKYKYISKAENTENDHNTIKTVFIDKLPPENNLIALHMHESKHSRLIAPLNFFSHRSQDALRDIKVLGDINNGNVFYFSGLKKYQKVTLNN